MSQDIVEQLRNAASEAECPIASLEGRAAGTIESLRARVAELEADKELVKLWQARADDREIINAAVVLTEQVDERINLSVRACLNVSTDDLRVAANARLDGLLKFKRSFDEQLAEKDQRIAELEEQLDLQIPAGVMAQQMKTIAAQALTIKTMREALLCAKALIDTPIARRKLSIGAGNECLTYLREALAIPDNSTEVLQEWLDKQLGEPVVKFNWNTGAFVWLTPYSHREHHNQPLYRKPEIK